MLMPLTFSSLVTSITVSSPVQIASCEILTPISVPQAGDQGGFDQIGNYELHVRFLNRGAEPISRVVFQLSDGTTVTDVGNFTQNALIDHRLPLDATHATGCSLSSVQLADGTTLSVVVPK